MKPVLCLAASLLVAGFFSIHSLPPRKGKIISPTRSFSFLGKWYSPGKPSKGKSLIWEEISRHGFDISRIPPGTFDPGDEVSDPLSEIPAKTRFRPITFPTRFRPENSLQMESEDGFIDISYGKIITAEGSMRNEIISEGWTFVAMEGHPGPFSLATIHTGRETSFVFLEEKEGNCLFVRRLKKK